ncbi:hypothetical protein HYC85_019809 [Camellia sinensis]|uniref:t-SNARE coiled-coil homology domain-containing protein n=1 Tax=Camellia sinensis TaxID=4442 RepID=A0A7J7GNX1_CAMSI|nr:hypothetical protein HYC85_019809 [Camellia sinensis]
MASRNRTILYRKYRDALKSVRVPSGSSTRGALTVGLPPAWVDVSEEIAANVQRVRVKIGELSKAHAKALMPSFGDGKEDQCRIEALTQEITGLLKKSEKRLQRLSAGGPSEDSNIRKNVQRSLATDLQSLSMELRKKQSTYLKRLRQQKEGPEPDGVDIEMNLNGYNSRREDDEFDDIGFNEHQMAKLRKSEAFTAEREREIQQVVESVNDLAQIMKDLSVLIIDQGTIVDRIDYNIQNVAASVEEGFKQLQKNFPMGRRHFTGSCQWGSPHWGSVGSRSLDAARCPFSIAQGRGPPEAPRFQQRPNRENVEALKAALRYKKRSAPELLEYQFTYRSTIPKKTRLAAAILDFDTETDTSLTPLVTTVAGVKVHFLRKRPPLPPVSQGRGSVAKRRVLVDLEAKASEPSMLWKPLWKRPRRRASWK